MIFRKRRELSYLEIWKYSHTRTKPGDFSPRRKSGKWHDQADASWWRRESLQIDTFKWNQGEKEWMRVMGKERKWCRKRNSHRIGGFLGCDNGTPNPSMGGARSTGVSSWSCYYCKTFFLFQVFEPGGAYSRHQLEAGPNNDSLQQDPRLTLAWPSTLFPNNISSYCQAPLSTSTRWESLTQKSSIKIQKTKHNT